MRTNPIKSLILLTLMTLALTQDNTTVEKHPINLNDMYSITLENGQTKIYTLTIKDLKANDSLFVEAASPTYDPYEIHIVVLRSDGNYQKLCAEETNEFVEICEVANQNLKEGRQFDIEIKCEVKCTLELKAFLSQTLQIEFGQKITINSQKAINTLQQLAIKVPDSLTFTDITLIANFLNGDDIFSGADIYINVGNENVAVPTTEDFMFKGREVWGDGIGVFLSKEQIKPGQWIKILLILGEGVEIEFYSQSVNGDTQEILLNTAYNDFTSENETKIYVLEIQQDSGSPSSVNASNTTTTTSNTSSKTIEIIFVIYSGVPSIKVGFDAQFKSSLDNYDLQGTLSYLITPQIRALNNYTGRIYIRVQSLWSSNYYLNSFTVSDRFYKLSDGIAQLNRAEVDEVQNYIYQSLVVIDDGDVSARESYRLRVEIISGLAEVGIRRCSSLQKPNQPDCLITNISQLQDKTIKDTFGKINITQRKDWDTNELLFDYDASTCQLYKKYAKRSIYSCEFQVIVFPAKLSNEKLVYSVTMFQNREEGSLKEAYPYKDFLFAGTYHYFDFELPDELAKVEEVTFFMTVISGDAFVMGTTNAEFKYMEFSDALIQNDIMLSLFNTITFKKDKLSNNKFYIAVYAYQTSDIAVNVIVKRIGQPETNSTTPNKTDVTTLYMTEGLSQQYTLSNGYESINFAFTAAQEANATVDLVEITGTVTFTLSKEGSDQVIKCKNEIQSGELKCTFSAEQYVKYIVHIKAQKSETQTFSISYYTGSVCKKYSFNLPQFVFMAPKQKQCSSYSITDKSRSLQVITSFSTIDLLTTNIRFTATFNNDHKIEWTGREKQITSDQLKEFCKSGNMSNCIMKLEYVGDELTHQKFYFVVEQVEMEMALFDGIVRKVVDQQMTQNKGKFFYYEVTSKKQSVKVFTTSRDKVAYYVGAKFVDIAQFTASPDSLYLTYRQNVSAPLQNTFQTRLSPQKGTSVIQIEPQQFTKHCKQCVLLISVFGLQAQSSEANIFEIEVTQTQSFLYLGEQQTGFLSENEIYVYDVYGNPIDESIIAIRDFLKESDKESNCFVASISEVGKKSSTSIAEGEHIIPKSAFTYKVFIQNVGRGVCAYQISFSALTKPITELTPYMPIELKLQNYETNYFIHHHRQQTSFQILSYIKSGDIKISANRVNQIVTIETLMGKNIDEYDFKSLPGDSFLEITSSAKFCKNCYYMIAVKGDPSVQAQLAIAIGNEPIELTTYGLLKQTLSKSQTQSYVYYSTLDFNLTFPLLLGEIRVTILTPTKQTLYNKTITQFTQIVVHRANVTQTQFIDYFTDDSKFEVMIEAVKDSSYYVSVKRKAVSVKVYEGIPITLALGTESKTVEFVNVNDEQDNVSLLFEVMDNNITAGNLTIDVIAQVMNGDSSQSTQLSEPIITQSENSINYVFNSVKGTYFITLKSNSKATVSFILVKKKLTHLMSSNVNLFTEKGTFEIYTPGNNLMVVVDTCLGEVEVKASEKYQYLSDDSSLPVVMLNHPNFGRHYLIVAEGIHGEFFVQVNPKTNKTSKTINNTPMMYMISYFFYEKSDQMPYKKVDIDPQISYYLSKGKIIFFLTPVRLLPSKQNFTIVPTYTLYISSNPNTTMMNSRCDLNVGWSVSYTPTDSELNDDVRFPIQLDTIADEVGEDTDSYYVSAKVKVKFEGDTVVDGYTPFIDMAYTKLQLSQSSHFTTIQYLLLWIVVPIIISLILFGLAAKFCIKWYRQQYPSNLVEEDREMNNNNSDTPNSIQKIDTIDTADNLKQKSVFDPSI